MKYDEFEIFEINLSGSDGAKGTHYNIFTGKGDVEELSYEELCRLQKFLNRYVESKKGGEQ